MHVRVSAWQARLSELLETSTPHTCQVTAAHEEVRITRLTDPTAFAAASTFFVPLRAGLMYTS
jgi:hypothetical protein